MAAALIGFAIYLGVKHLSWLWILISTLDLVIVGQATHRLVLNIAKPQPRSAEDVVDRLSLVAQLIVAVVLAAASIGQVRGWMHGTYGNVIRGLFAVYVIGAPIYWLGGKRRLVAALAKRATGDGQGGVIGS
jgi:hypothetical protein